MAPRGSILRFARYCATRAFLPLLALLTFASSLTTFSGSAQAASNSTINFQARILQSSGALVDDGDYNVEFKIYDVPSVGGTAQGACSGNCLWMETRTGLNTVRVVNGYVTASLGSVTPFGATIPWDQDLYVTMRVGGIGTPVWDTEMVNATTGRMKMSATSYAFRSAVLMNATNTAGFNADQLVQLGPSAPQAVNSAGSAISVNQTGAGTLLDLRSAGTSKLTVDASGNTVVLGTVDVRGSSLNVGTSSVAGSLILNDGSANTTTLQSASTASNLTFVLPSSYGSNGDCLTGNGAGVLSFASTCGGTLSVNPTANVRKSADQTQTSATNPTAALTDDTELKFAIGANETWSFRFVITANSNATPDIKFAVTAPALAACKIGANDQDNGNTIGNLACGASTGIFATATAEDTYEVFGTVVNGTNPGNITLQWAQNTANAAATIVRAGSFVNANRIAGPGQTAQAFIQNGNSFGATAVLGTNDSQALSVLTSGVERIRVLSSGNVGIGVASPASLFSVGTASAFQVNASGNISTTGTATIGGLSTMQGSVVASGAATGTTATADAVAGVSTTTINTSAVHPFVVNDVLFINNAGQDYYTRVTATPTTTSVTVSPAISYDASAPLTKYTIQNVGATPTDYTTQANRFFQGYFLGGVVVGAGSTTLSDGSLSRSTGDIQITPGSGGIVNVNGTINATTITGDGSAITNISGASISGSTITGLDASNISTGTVNDARLSANVALLNSSPTFTGALTASSLAGSGSGITALDASNISTGTLNDARLSSNISLLSGAQTFSGLKTFGAGASVTAGQALTVNGDAFTDLTGTGLAITSGSLGVVYGSGANTSVEGNTSLTVSAGTGLSGGGTITLGSGGTATLNVAYGSTSTTAVRGDTSITCASGSGNLSGGGNSITLGSGGTCNAITTNSAVTFGTSVTSPIYTGAGAVSLSSGGVADLTLDSASNVLVLSDATMRRVAAGSTTVELNDAANTTYAITNTNGVGVADLSVEGSVTATSFVGDGSGLTNLNGASISNLDASNISSGTLNDSRLSSNVAVLNLSQTFTALKTFGAGASITTGQTITINGDAFTDLTGTGLAISGNSLTVVYGASSGSAVEGNTSVSVAAGTGLTGGSTITLGSGGTATLNVAYGSTSTTAVRGDTAITCASGSGNLTGGGNSITLGSGGTCGAISTNSAVSFGTSVTTPSLASSTALTIASGGANTIGIDTGSAAGITIGGTNANSLTLGNSTTAVSINGTTIVLGSSTVRRTAAGTTNYEFNDTANTTLNIRNTDVTAVANVTVEGAFTAASLTGSGSGITALDAGNVSAGTLGDSRLSNNVATLTGAQSFSGAKTFGAGAIVTTGQTLTINGEAFSDLTGTGLTFSGGTLAIDSTYFNANYIQLGAASLQTDASTNATIGINKTGATGNILTLQKNGAGVFSVGNTGAVTITNTSTSAFSVSGATLTFSVDSSGNIVRIGPATADATGTVFVLDTKNNAGDPTGGSAVNGAQYYNSNSNKFRCFENGAWADCLSQVVLVKKTANEPKTNNAALGTDTALQFAMAANTTYAIECKVFFDTANAPDFKYATVGPAAPTSVRTVRSHIIPGTAVPVDGVDLAATASTAVVGTGTTGGYVTLETIWQNGANAGTWGFQWAQNTSNAATTSVLGGSQCTYSIR